MAFEAPKVPSVARVLPRPLLQVLVVLDRTVHVAQEFVFLPRIGVRETAAVANHDPAVQVVRVRLAEVRQRPRRRLVDSRRVEDAIVVRAAKVAVDVLEHREGKTAASVA